MDFLCSVYDTNDNRSIDMSRRPGLPMQQVFTGHLGWLQDQGPSYKRQAASCKRQAFKLHKPGTRVKNRFNRKR